jgi:hypothetical protein
MFVKMLDKLTAQINLLLEHEKTEQVWKILGFFDNLVSDQNEMKTDHKDMIFGSLAALPLPVLEKLIIKTLYLPGEEDIKTAFKKLLKLFPSKLITLLINFLIFNENLPKVPLLREIITANYHTGALKPDFDLKKTSASQITRFMDILKDLNSDDTFPFLSEIASQDNIIIAKRSLEIIASKRSDKVLPFLLKAVDGPDIPLRIVGIECLGRHDTPKTRSILADISQGKINMTDSPLENVDIRVTALRSLELLDKAQAVKIFKNILNKKQFFFMFAEPKKLRVFAAERLKKYQKQGY